MKTKKLREVYAPSVEIIANIISDARKMSAGRVWVGVMTGIKAIILGVAGAEQAINQAILQ